MEITFYKAEYLYALLGLIPLLLLSLWSYYHRKNKLNTLAPQTQMRNILMPDRIGIKRLYRDILFILALACAVVALARPRRLISGSKSVEREGLELVFCVDISNSMLCQDVAPSRLEFAKKGISNLLEELGDNKVALIAFADEAYCQMPLTTDFLSTKEYVNTLEPDFTSAQGTSIAEALALAEKSFSTQKDIGKAIILITDVEDFDDEKETLDMARSISDKGIKLCTIGVGSVKGGVIPMPNGSYLKDDIGKVVITSHNPILGKAIAESSKGSFSSFTSTDKLVSAMERQLKDLPRASLESTKAQVYEEFFVYWLIVAFVLLVLEFLFLERRNHFFQKYRLFKDEK